MQPKSLFFVLFFLTPIYLFTQSGIVSGKITDAENKALVGVTIAVLNTSVKTITDVDGKFRIANLSKGIYTLEASYIGYAVKQISNVEIVNKQVTTLNITLESRDNTLKAV